MTGSGRAIIWLMMIFVLVIVPVTLLAQEEIEKTPSPTVTLTATASPTATSTPSATATATHTATSIVTQTATATDSPTETLAPSPELTAEITESASEPGMGTIIETSLETRIDTIADTIPGLVPIRSITTETVTASATHTATATYEPVLEFSLEVTETITEEAMQETSSELIQAFSGETATPTATVTATATDIPTCIQPAGVPADWTEVFLLDNLSQSDWTVVPWHETHNDLFDPNEDTDADGAITDTQIVNCEAIHYSHVQGAARTAFYLEFENPVTVNRAGVHFSVNDHHNYLTRYYDANGILIQEASTGIILTDEDAWSSHDVTVSNVKYLLYVLHVGLDDENPIGIIDAYMVNFIPSPTPTPSPTPISCSAASAFQANGGIVAFSDGDDCPNPTPTPNECVITLSQGISFRTARDTTDNSRILIIADDDIADNDISKVSNLYDFPGQWDLIPGGNPLDWQPNTLGRLVAVSWHQDLPDEIVWIGVRLENVSDNTISPIQGYMAQRLTPTSSNLLSLSCMESDLPGYNGPQPTSTPGPSPTPNPLYWYVICDLRSGENPPIEVNVRTWASTQAQQIATLGPGTRVERISINPNDEVDVGGGVIYVQIVDEWNSPTSEAWVARNDSLGALLTPTRGTSCATPTATPTSLPPTSTPDPGVPLVSPGGFADNSPNGLPVVFSSTFNQEQSTVGVYGFHSPPTAPPAPGKGLILDIMPRAEEACTDNPNCQPNEVVVYSPVNGGLWVCDIEGPNITITFNQEDYTVNFSRGEETYLDVRREIQLSHVIRHPDLPNCAYTPVIAGQEIGTVDTNQPMDHVAFQLRLHIDPDENRGQFIRATEEELLGVITSGGYCLYDDWLNVAPPLAYENLPAGDSRLDNRIRACSQ